MAKIFILFFKKNLKIDLLRLCTRVFYLQKFPYLTHIRHNYCPNRWPYPHVHPQIDRADPVGLRCSKYIQHPPDSTSPIRIQNRMCRRHPGMRLNIAVAIRLAQLHVQIRPKFSVHAHQNGRAMSRFFCSENYENHLLIKLFK